MSSLIIYQTLQRGLHQRGLAWAVVVVTRSFLSWVGAFKQRSIRRGQRRPLRATVSWWDLICTGVPVWAAMPCSDPACRLRQPNPASGLNSIDQVRTQSSLRDYRRGRVRARTRVYVCPVHDSHIGMELLALKHEWLLHGPVEKGWSFRSDQNSSFAAEKRQYAANATA